MAFILIVNFLILYKLYLFFQSKGQSGSFMVNHPRSSSGVEITERNPADVYRDSERKTIKKIYFLLCLPTGRFIYEQWIRLIQMRSHKVNRGHHSPNIELEVVNFDMPCTPS